MWRPWETESTERGTAAGAQEASPAAEKEKEKQPKAKSEQSSAGRKHKFLSYEEMNVILNVYNKLKSDGEKQALDKTAEATGSSRTSVWRIVKYGAKNRKVRRDKGINKKEV